MSELPETWAECPIGEVCKVIGGGTPPSHDESNFTKEDGTPWITPADLSGYRAKYIRRGRRSLTSAGLANSSAKLMPAGTVLFSSRAPVGYVVVAANEVATNQGFRSFLVPHDFDSSYLYYYLRHIKPEAEARATGTTFKELSGSAAAKLPLLVAPSSEQKRIASKLDALFVKVDACRERLEQVPQILKKFREAVLEAAVSGRLTEEWRATRPLQSSVNTYPIAERPDGARKLPEGWNWHAIGDLAVKVSDGVHKKPAYLPAGVPFITVKDLTAGPGIDFSNTRFISKADHDEFIRRTHPEQGDLLVSKDGTLGVIRLVDTDRAFSIFVSVALIKLKDKSLAEYMRIALEAPVVQKQMVGVGSGLQHIHLQDLRKDVVPLPPHAEQKEIVRRVAQLSEFANGLSGRYEGVVAGVELLTPSVLAKAFRGELVPQDPNDEPVGEMLERIREQQTTGTMAAARRTKPPTGKAGRRLKIPGGRRLRASSG